MNQIEKLIPYPFGKLFYHGMHSRGMVFYHRVLAIFLYGQLFYYQDGWIQFYHDHGINQGGEYNFRAACMFFCMVMIFFHRIGSSGEHQKIDIKSEIAAALGLPLGIFYVSFSEYPVVIIITESNWFLYPHAVLGLFNFFICLFSYAHILWKTSRS